MNIKFIKRMLCVLMVFLMAATFGCGKKEDSKTETAQSGLKQTNEVAPGGSEQAAVTPSILEPQQAAPRDVVVSVDGNVLKKDELTKRVKIKMNLYKDKIPADKKKQIEAGVKKQILEEFVVKTILNNEADRKKIAVTQKDVRMFYGQIKENLPPDKKVEDFLKENGVSQNDIALGIKIRKLVEMETGKKSRPSEQEISKFYTENKEKFITPESVHVRHILVTIDAKDDEKTRNEKKARIEDLRKKVLDGADFAEIAKNNSDCPSRENGGDLGEIKRGQTVKHFEDAAFSQEVNTVGPVVTTEYGHHVIQVLGRTPASTTPLAEVKEKIALYLEQQKQAEIFSQMMAKLRKNAVIMYYENE